MSIVGSQIRMARAALRWSVSELSEHSRVSISTIKRMELEGELTKVTEANAIAVLNTLENAGIEFIGTPEDRPGIRIRSSKPE